MQGPELDEERAAAEMQFGGPRGAAGQWASCVRVIDPATASTVAVLELDENEVRRGGGADEGRSGWSFLALKFTYMIK